MIDLQTLRPSQTRRRYKRLGRGNSSGKGTTAGRGTKGQRARTGGRNKLTRRGLQHLIVRTPKVRGFLSRRPKLQTITLDQLQQYFANEAIVSPEILAARGLISSIRPGLKVIGRGPLAKKLTIKAHKFSAGAAAAISKAGGTMVTLTVPLRLVPKPVRT